MALRVVGLQGAGQNLASTGQFSEPSKTDALQRGSRATREAVRDCKALRSSRRVMLKVARSELPPAADETEQSLAMDELDEAIANGDPMAWELDPHNSSQTLNVAMSEISTAAEEPDEALAVDRSYPVIETGEPMLREAGTDYSSQISFKAARSDDLFSANGRAGLSLAHATWNPIESVDDTDRVDGTAGCFSRVQGPDDISLRGEETNALRARSETAPASSNQDDEPSAAGQDHPSDRLEVGTNENAPELGQDPTVVDRPGADARSDMAVPGSQSNVQERECGDPGSGVSKNRLDQLTALVEDTSRKIMNTVAESVGDELANLAYERVSGRSGHDDLSEQIIVKAHSKPRSQEPGPSACQTSQAKYHAGREQIKEKIVSKILATKVQVLIREVLTGQMTRSDVGRETPSPDSSPTEDASSKEEHLLKCGECPKTFRRKCALK